MKAWWKQTQIETEQYIHFRYREAIQNVSYQEQDDEILDCGNTVNFTFYDDLIGIAQRFNHPIVPEPEVNLQFCLNTSTR